MEKNVKLKSLIQFLGVKNKVDHLLAVWSNFGWVECLFSWVLVKVLILCVLPWLSFFSPLRAVVQSQCLCNYLFIYIWLFMQLRVHWISSSDWLTQAYMCNLQKVFVKDSRMLPSQPLSVPCQQYVKLWWSSFTKKKK